MPAARPTQPAILNAINAVKAAGFVPGALVIQRDGSFRVEIGSLLGIAPVANVEAGPPRWEDVA